MGKTEVLIPYIVAHALRTAQKDRMTSGTMTMLSYGKREITVVKRRNYTVNYGHKTYSLSAKGGAIKVNRRRQR